MTRVTLFRHLNIFVLQSANLQMKRSIITLIFLCGAVITSIAQTGYTTVKDLVEGNYYGKLLTIKAQFVKVDNYNDLTFIVEDQDYIIPIKLVKQDLGAENRFRSLNLKQGDTLIIKGSCSHIRVKYESDSYKGLEYAKILDVKPCPPNDLCGGYPITNEDEMEEMAIPFQLVEMKPTFRGGDANNFSKWVNERLVYPEEAKKNKVQGKVMLQFTVEEDGRVTNVRVLNGVHPTLDAEAVRVVSGSPNWTPGKQRDKAVRVTYTFPVIFQLR